MDALRAEVGEILADADAQGAGLAVVTRDGVVWAGGVGWADEAARRPVDADTVFAAASVSKVLIGLTLLGLCKDGGVPLETPVRDLAPELPLRNPWETTHPVRVRHLLEHTTGLQEVVLAWYDDALPRYLTAGEALLGHAPAVTVRWPPGDVTTYSNYNYIAASYLIEKLSGRRFDEAIQDRILGPLGMTASTFRRVEVDPARLAKGYATDPPRTVEPVESFYQYAAGLWTTPRDLGRLMHALLRGGEVDGVRIADDALLAEMEEPRSSLAARRGLRLGHGAGVARRQTEGRVLAGHGGAIDGFLASFYYDREKGYGFAVLLNAHLRGRTPSRPRLESAILEGFFPETRVAAAPATLVGDEELRGLTGLYRLANPRFRVTGFGEELLKSAWVGLDGGRLTVRRLGGDAEALVPAGDGRFRLPHEVLPRFAFGTLEDGRRFLADVPDDFLVEADVASSLALLAALAAALAIVVAYPLAAAWRLAWSRAKGRLTRAEVGATLAPAFATLVLLAVPLCAYPIDTSQEGTSLNAATFGIFVFTALFPVVATGALWVAGRAYARRPGGFALVRIGAAAGAAFLAGFLAVHGAFAVALWISA